MTDTSVTRRRRTPSQARSRDTVDAICTAAAAIIEEEGIAALTTNAVASRAGVSITSVYAYFPDKLAIVRELFERFERLRGDALATLGDDLRTAPEWRPVMDRVWDRMARFRVEVPAGRALRSAMHSSPELAELDLQGSERSAQVFANLMVARRPSLDPGIAYRAAWAATLVAGTLLDDVVRGGTIDHVALDEGKRLIKRYLAVYLDDEP